MGMTQQKRSHHPYILCHFANYVLCLLFVWIGGLWKAVGWVVLRGCVVHVDVHRKVLCCGWLQLNCYWAWQMWSLLYAETVVCMSSAKSVGVWVNILLLLNMANMGCLVCGRLWSEQCWVPCWWYSLCIHLVGVNRLICMSRVLWCG